MKKYNLKLGFTSLLLSFVLLLGFLLSSFPIGTPIYSKANEDTSDNIPTVEEEMEEFLARYDEYEYFLGEEEGEIIIRETVSIPGGVEIYQTSINYLNEDDIEFSITISTYHYDELIEEEYLTVEPAYDELEDEYYVTINEGEQIYLSTLILPNTVESRIAIADDIAIAAAYLAISAVIICYPYIQTIVQTVYTRVTTFLSNFWGWLRNIFTTKIVVTTTTTTVLSYRINVFGREFELDQVINANDQPRDADFYYLAVIRGYDVYISEEEISEAEAVSVLMTNTKVSMGGTMLQLNTYTFIKQDAESIAIQAAVQLGRTGAEHHEQHNKNNNKKGTFFHHYHPGAQHTPHSFYGFPYITL